MGEPKIENDRRNAVGNTPPHDLALGHPKGWQFSLCVCVCVVWGWGPHTIGCLFVDTLVSKVPGVCSVRVRQGVRGS